MSPKPQQKRQEKEDLITVNQSQTDPVSNDNDTDLKPAPFIAAPSVGLLLRTKRIEKSFQKEDIAAILHISYIYVNAIEEGLTHQLPERVYTLGYIRSYARLVGLDPEKTAHQFGAEFFKGPLNYGLGSANNPSFPRLDKTPEKKKKISLRRTAALLTLTLTAIFIIYTQNQGDNTATVSLKKMSRINAHGTTIDTSPSILDHVAAFLSLNTVSVTKKGDKKIPLPHSNPKKKKAPILPGLAYSDEFPTIQTHTLTPSPAPKIQEKTLHSLPQAKTFTSDNSKPAITLYVRELCWVEIKDQNQKVLLSGNLKPGETYNVPKRPGLLLSVGNAGGILIGIGSKTPTALGNSGDVRHNISLDDQHLMGAPSLPR